MPPVQLGPLASTFLVAFYLLASLALLILIGAVAFALFKLNALLEEYRQKIDPLLEKADAVLTITNEKVSTLGERAEELLIQGEAVAETVHDRVDRTTIAVQRTVNAPLISINSLAAGLTRGWTTFSRLQQDPVRTRAAEAVRVANAAGTEQAVSGSIPLVHDLNGPLVASKDVTETPSEARVDLPSRREYDSEAQPVLARRN